MEIIELLLIIVGCLALVVVIATAIIKVSSFYRTQCSIVVSCVCVNAYILWRRETAEHTTAHSFSGLICIYNRSQYLLGRMGIWMFGDAVSGSHDIAALLRSDYCNSWPFSTSNNTRN